MSVIPSQIRYHNNIQLEYFGEEIKPTMIPVDSPYVRNHIDKCIQLTGLDKSERIMEVGCGMGKFTLPLVGRGYTIIGLDLSPFLLQKLLEYNNNRFRIPLLACDVLDMPEDFQGQLDTVLGFFTLHHMHAPDIVFTSLYRQCRPGGRVVFIEPNPLNPLYYLQIMFSKGMEWQAEKNILLLTPRKLKKAAALAGFQSVVIKRYGAFPPVLFKYPLFQKIERIIERIPFFKPFLPFQYIELRKSQTVS